MIDAKMKDASSVGEAPKTCTLHLSSLSALSAFRAAILVTLTFSTSTTVLLMRYSKIEAERQGETGYLSSSVVFVTECVKVVVCMAALLLSQGFVHGALVFKKEIWNAEALKLILPATFYALQNNLLYRALTHLDSTTFQITYQLKILITAIFSVLMLKRHLQRAQWLALVLLTVGVVMVEVQNSLASKKYPSKDEQSSSSQNTLLGISCVLVACLTSGGAGVYFELLVKTSAQKSIVIRNLQLGLLSIFVTFMVVMTEDFSQNTFFQGYNRLTAVIIMFQSMGGLLVALVVKYADNILKGFSTSISIVVCSAFSFLVLDDRPPESGIIFFAGTTLVVLATFMYGYSSHIIKEESGHGKSNGDRKSLLPK